MRRLAQLIGCLALLWLPACVGTPVPQPPALEEPDPTQLFNASTPEFIGGPGAVPEGDLLWIAPLDAVDDPVLIPVAADGSFTSTIIIAGGQEARLQARSTEGGRSRPIDIQVPVAAELVRATEACLLLEPEREVIAPRTAAGGNADLQIQVTNNCGADATFTVELHRPDARWVVEAPGPITIGDGASDTVRVTYRPDAPGLHEEILFLMLTSPEVERRVITLSGTGL